MIVTSLKYFLYDLPFVKPLRTASGDIKKRSGIIVALTDEHGNTAYGEIAPLELLSMTPLDKCVEQVKYVQDKVHHQIEVPEIFHNENFSPEVMFGLEQAVDGLKHKSGPDANPNQGAVPVGINALVDLTDDNELTDRIQKLLEEGYNTVKIKIDNVNLDKKINTINYLGEQFGSELNIRLDANMSLVYKDAVEVLSGLNPNRVEYVEDPVRDLDDVIKLQDEVEVNIALDEFITLQNAGELLDHSPIRYFIIKPMKFGFTKTLDIINHAALKNKSVIISSVFESAVGRSVLVYLASLTDGKHAHGLDTKKYLGEDLDDDLYRCDKPMIEFNRSEYPPDFNLKRGNA